MQRALVSLFRAVPVEVLYAVMALVVPFYMVFNRAGYRSTYNWFRRHMGHGPLKSLALVYKNHFVFGQIILDRFAMYSGAEFRFSKEGIDGFDEALRSPEGVLLLSSHVGNYELAGYSLSAGAKKMNVLVFAGETETVMANRRRMFARNGISMIPMSEDLSHIFAINSALISGEIVSLPGDRIFGSPKSLEAEFMGREAHFPMGPFAIAVQRQVPTFAVFVMKESRRCYRIIMKRLQLGDEGTRADKMAGMAHEFAAALESMMRRYSTQWFNYYDFWASDVPRQEGKRQSFAK